MHSVPSATPPAAEFTGTCTLLVDAAEDAGLTTLLGALAAADLLNIATAENAELTIFAPTNAAFQQTLDALGLALDDLLEDVDLLFEILSYHILPSPRAVVDLTSGESFATLLGLDSSCGVGNVSVEVGEEVTIVGGETVANIEIPDVETCSGIVHIVDSVLLPCPLDAEGTPFGE